MTRRRAAQYGVAIGSVVIAVAVRLALDPVLADRFPFATLFLAVVVTAHVGGFGPAILATLVGLLAAALVMPGPDQQEFYATDVGRAGLLLYLVVATGIAALGGAARHARQRALASERALREHDHRKNQFIATLAHELRNPLSAIGMSVALLRDAEDASTSEPIGVIARQTRQIERLVEDLVDVTRIALGKIRLEKQVCDVRDIVSRSIEATRAQVERREHRLDADLPREPVAVEVDPARLQQVFGNLLSNAARYTPPGGTISVRAKRVGAAVAVHVRDSGVGIEADKKVEIFEPFVQLAGGERGGLGVGLAVVKKLVELHGGRVEVRSQGAGTGAEFVVTLPVALRPIDCRQ